jgi:hypothetical protein
LATGTVTHKQVLTVVIKKIDIVPRNSLGQARTHFAHKDVVPQALGFANFVQMARPGHFDFAPASGRRRLRRHGVEMK